MPDTLLDRLTQLRRRVMQLVSVYGASWIIAVVLSAILVAGTLDWLVHLDDPGIRLILCLGVLAGGGWVAWKTLIAPLRTSLSDVELALRIERRYPGFQDSLASTVQFLAAGRDARLGSPELQQQVVSDTLARIDAIDVDDVVETRDVRKIVVAAIVVCLSAVLVTAMNQTAAATALHRLFFPFSAGPWPRETELRFVTPQFQAIDPHAEAPLRAAQGSLVELYVENVRGDLPEDVRLVFGKEGASPSTERLRRATVRDEQGLPREVCVAPIPAQHGPLVFRALGGDDDQMPWHRLDVIPPPVVEELRLTLTPPKYTRRAVEKLPAGVGHIQGLVGTRVDVAAKVNKPLKSASLRVKDAPPAPMTLASDGRSFTASFVIKDNGVYSYWFDLKDLQAFENPEAPRYEIRGIADLVPEVTIEEPPGDLTVTATAKIPFRLTARDDLGLKSVQLVYRSADGDAAGTNVMLYESGRNSEEPGNDVSDAPPQQQHVAEYELDLAPLALQPGGRVFVHGEATDDFDLGSEHVGRSILRVLTVISPEEKTIELAARQSSIVDELEKVVQSQQRSREQIGELLLQLQKAGKLQPADVDLLKRIELDQKQITSRLADPIDSVESRTRGIVRELQQNGIDDAAMKSRLEQLADDVTLLKEESLPKIEQELTLARKTVLEQPAKENSLSPTSKGLQGKTPENPPNKRPGEGELKTPTRPEGDAATTPQDGKPEDQTDPSKKLESPETRESEKGALQRAGAMQDIVLETLGDQLQKLSEWRSRRDIAGELNEIIGGQKQLNEETGDVGKRTLSKQASDLTAQDQADLARLAERQSRHADRLGQLRSKLGDLADDLEGANPEAARTLREAEEDLRRQTTAERLREAAGELEKNNVGRATAAQQQSLDELNELQNVLRDRAPSDTEELVKRLKEAESQLDSLRKREETLQKKVRDAAEIDNPAEREAELEKLQKEQQKLREEMEGMVRRLRRMGARNAIDPARRAAERMQEAEQRLQRQEQAPAEEEVQEALDDLEQAQREVAKQRREAEEQLARELLERIADEIRSMMERQNSVIAETERLDKEYRDRGNWTRGQLKTLVGVAEVQRSLQQGTEKLAEQVQAAEVFALALRGAARQMSTAATRLSERKTDSVTVDAEKAALKRFVDLLESLKPEKPAAKGNEEDQPQGQDEQPKPEEGPPSDTIPQLAQLKMLKSIQEDLLERTARLDEVREKNGSLSPDEQNELDALALEQGQLADLARNLVKQFARPSDEDDQKPAKE